MSNRVDSANSVTPAFKKPPAAKGEDGSPVADQGPAPRSAVAPDSRQGSSQGRASEIDKEAMVLDVMKDGPKGVVQESLDFWNSLGESDGAKGVVGKAMAGLLEFSGLPAVERSAGELGARVGVGDSAGNIAKSAGKLAFHSGVVALNGLAAGKALTSLAKGSAVAAEAVPQVIRHYTSAEKAAKIMQSGEIWASKAGNAGVNKVYLLAEGGASKGMNALRRLNIGYGRSKETAKAIEINLSKLPPEVAKRFQKELASGPLNLERFITHKGNLDFNDFRSAVRVLDTEQLAVTMQQLGKAGASLAKAGALTQDARQGVQGSLNTR